METKLCADCRQDKPLSAFGKDKSNPDGLRRICKQCAVARTKAWKQRGQVEAQPIRVGQRQCSWCGEVLDLDQFDEGYRQGRVCHSCRKNDWKRKHGADYDFDRNLKRCVRCGEWRGFELFSRDRRSPGGLKPYCRLCYQAEARYRQDNPPPKEEVSTWKVEPEEGGKVCSKCHTYRPMSAFYAQARSKDGHAGICKACYQERYRALRELPKNIPETKLCPKCGQVKSYRDFHRSRGRMDGLTTHCKECQRDYFQSAEGRANRKRVNDRRRAEGGGVLTIAMWEALLSICDHSCPRCQRPFTAVLQPQVDHIVPQSKGGQHTLTNVQPLCPNCNAEKNAFEIRDYRPADKLAQIYTDFGLT